MARRSNYEHCGIAAQMLLHCLKNIFLERLYAAILLRSLIDCHDVADIRLA